MNSRQRQAIKAGQEVIKSGGESIARLKTIRNSLYKDLLIVFSILCGGLLFLGAPEFLWYVQESEFIGFSHGEFSIYLAQTVYYGFVIGGMGMFLRTFVMLLYSLVKCWKTMLFIQANIKRVQRQLGSFNP